MSFYQFIIDRANIFLNKHSLRHHSSEKNIRACYEGNFDINLLDTEIKVMPHPILQHHPTRHKMIVAN